jgi:hypothetical protein
MTLLLKLSGFSFARVRLPDGAAVLPTTTFGTFRTSSRHRQVEMRRHESLSDQFPPGGFQAKIKG